MVTADEPARPPVREAVTDAEREAIWAFRYRVYVQELGRKAFTADHERRWLHDAEDDQPYTTHLYTQDARGLTGAVRFRCWAPGEVPPAIGETFSLERFDAIQRLTVAETGRLMVAPSARGSTLFVALVTAAFELQLARHEADLIVMNCATGLIRHYRRIGLRPYDGRLVPTSDGIEVPLALFTSDVATLRGAGSFLCASAERHFGPGGREPLDLTPYAPLFEAPGTALEVDPDAVWKRLEQRLLGPDETRPAMLDSLSPATVRKLSGEGLLLTVPAGELLTEKGLGQRELFVVIEGLFEASVDGQRTGLIEDGDVIGELAFFSTSGRRIASVRAVSDGRVLVLRRHFIDELRESDPACAAEIIFALARVLADRAAPRF